MKDYVYHIGQLQEAFSKGDGKRLEISETSNPQRTSR